MSNRNKKYYQTLLLLLILLTAYSLQLNAIVRFVSKTGLSIPPYTSWETAADSIQKCINICVFGDTIYVADGVYEEQIGMIPGLALIGAGMDSCVIDTRNLVNDIGFRSVQVADSCLLKGFYINVYYNSDMGYGIFCLGSGLVTENLVTNGISGIFTGPKTTIYKNYCSENRVGIYAHESDGLVRNNIIYMTYSVGHGISISSIGYHIPIIDSNFIEIETNGIGIIKGFGANPTIKNNTIILIGGDTGILLDPTATGSIQVINNLIISEIAVSGIDNGASNVKIDNNLLLGYYYLDILRFGPPNEVKNNSVINAEGNISLWNGYTGDLFQYNNVWKSNINYFGFIPDTTNISFDPMVVNDDTTQGELDFHLQKYSPLIDAGDPNILDKDGSRSDIGLYGGPYGESYTYQDLAPKPPRGLFAVVDSSIITLTWNRNTEADFNHYNLYRDTTSNFIIDSTKLVASLTDTFYLHIIPPGVERLYFKITGVDNQGNESNPSEEVAVILVSVKNEWKPVNNYILYQNYPNPFNPTTKIGYKLKERGYVKLYIYDVKGELIEVLVNQTQEAGYYEVEFNGEGKTELIGVKNPFVSGVYLCQIIIQNEKGIPVFSDMIKMILLK